MSTRQKTSKTAIKGASRQRQCVRLRRRGWTYQQIGDELGITAATAYEHVSKALAKVRAETHEKATEIVEMELQRIDAMIKGLADKAEEGDVQAVDRVIKLMIRRSKYLQLDAPQQFSHEHKGEDAIDAKLRELLLKRSDIRAGLVASGGNGKAPSVH